MPPAWEAIAAAKRQRQRDSIPTDWLIADSYSSLEPKDVAAASGILSKVELEITEHDASFLLGALASKKWSSEAVTAAFCKRAAIAHQLTNCLTEIFFQDGIARAKMLDEHLKRYGKPYGPLHGLPISIKDSFKVKGYDASLGVAAFCNKPAEANSALVDLLLSLGAVLYCKTNIPQTLSSLDSHNNIFGRTLNPINRALTAGGSSGGEGALVAMRGSPLGIGTDVGGSIRVPAMCNGLIGIKPSHGRVPYAGQQGGLPDGSSKITMEATAGPIARSLRDCALFLQIIADNKPEIVDPDVFAQSWAHQTPLHSLHSRKSAPLRIGIVRTDGHVRPLPPIMRLLDEVELKLRRRKLNVELIDVDASGLLSKCVKVFNGIMSIDGGNAWFDHLESNGEPLSPWLQGRLKRRERKPVEEIVKLQAQRTALQAECLSLWQHKIGRTPDDTQLLDVLICPPAPHPVAPIDGWNTVNYTSAWNLLDWPAGILPVRSVTAEDVKLELDTASPLNGWDKINQELWTKVDRNIYVGSPLSIQVVAPRLQERKLVESMAVIEGILGSTSRSRL